ncbi:glycosyltransferase family 9 protein [Pantoea sp. JGM49]|jgi:ADP-heptose:LPS heptosyltransferase|uniref:glycosyltransferase family 9 protein n=1 Tax=unclassified Pantoea TaxID=2630326 RepID=UPI00073E1BA8|nr:MULTISPECIES: glycosyltransferase family 9 protein [unclassified Pantoea]MBS0883068.1 glycosyltransferase family 9 protein [Pantoea sp. JGM49]MDI9279455.1 glycosyltransferase family 9 protein [Pantoea sp. EABMAA-21]MXP54983.1 glycosyltransferase family 9 protein [Pantoea sp. Seng]
MKKLWKINVINNVLSLHARLSQIDKNKTPLSSNHEFKRIVIFSTTALGDLLFNTPAIKAIKHRYPEARLMLVSSDKNRDLVEKSQWFDEIVIWDNKIVHSHRVIRRMRKFKPDMTVLLHSTLGYDILCARLSGSKYIIRDNFRSDNTVFNHWIDHYSSATDVHIIQRKLDLISILGCNTTDIRMQFPIAIHSVERENYRPVIGFQMGASGKNRCWPVEHFSELAERILENNKDAKIVLTGATQDKNIEKSFFDLLKNKYHSRVHSYIGKTRLPELLQIIKNLDVLITGDTGPLHIAITAETPTVSLYVSANPRHTGPYQDLHIHQTIRIEPESNDDPHYPLRKISVDQVYNVMMKNISV